MQTYKIGFAVVLTLCAALVSAVGAQQTFIPAATVEGSRTTPALANDAEAVVTALEREWAAAIIKKDVTVLERLIADDFNGTSPTAHTFTKTIAVQDLKSDRYIVRSMVLDEISVNVYGDVAIAFTSQKEVSEYAGKDTSGHYHFTDVWVKTGNRWQVVASHGSRFNEDHQVS